MLTYIRSDSMDTFGKDNVDESAVYMNGLSTRDGQIRQQLAANKFAITLSL